jgi:hypothetical protein
VQDLLTKMVYITILTNVILENNTTTLIDNQIGVLDTYIEPIKGLAVIVNNITVLKTGSNSSGRFPNTLILLKEIKNASNWKHFLFRVLLY